MERPTLTVDSIIPTKDGKIVLVERKHEPFRGFYALPGGIVEYGEKVEDACIREVFEETGLRVRIKKLLGVYSDPGRDPRGHFITVVFLCTPAGGKIKRETEETKGVGLFSPAEIRKMELACDHKKILKESGIV